MATSFAPSTNLGTSHGLRIWYASTFPVYDAADSVQAVRANGQILATDSSKGVVHLIDPANPAAEPLIVAQFPTGSVPTGIAEMEDDVFYVNNELGYVYNFTFNANSASVWKVDMRAYSSTNEASVSKVVDVAGAAALNGMVTVCKDQGILLLADSEAGLIWRLNVNTLAYEVVLDDALLKPNATAHPPFGVNGVRISGSTLYFSNTNYGYLATVPISSDGTPTGAPTLLTSDVPTADDFAIGRDGSVWLCQNVDNTFVHISPSGQIETIAGGQHSTELVGPVSTVFGRRPEDRDTLYIGTDGLLLTSKGVALTTDGKIAAIDTKQWSSW